MEVAVARKKQIPERSGRAKADTSPKFPYTTKPASLRRLLKEIPKKPKPAKFDMGLLRSWGFSDANDYSMLRVLKAINLLNDKNEPTELYSQFMKLDVGAKAIGPELRRVYAPLFQASHTPYNENNEALQNLFNIHSGGGDRTLDQQIQTFKALSENTSFDQTPLATPGDPSVATGGGIPQGTLPGAAGTSAGPIVNINLHIHLPDNKSRRRVRGHHRRHWEVHLRKANGRPS
jgi:Family of unknown function (DUF5343)